MKTEILYKMKDFNFQYKSPLEKAKNPCDFEGGEVVEDVYDGKLYLIIEPDKRGMAKLQLMETLEKQTTGRPTDWNSCNNRRFMYRYTSQQNPVYEQLSLF